MISLGLAAAEIEVDGDLRIHFGGLAIQEVRLVAPPLNRRDRRRPKHLWTADNLEFLNRARLRDHRMHNHSTRDVSSPCDRRINRILSRKLVTGYNAARY